VNSPNFNATLTYDSGSGGADTVYLTLTAALGADVGLAANHRKVAGAINTFFNSGGSLPASVGGLFNLTGDALADALARTSGEAATGAQQGAFQLGNQFLGMMLDPFAGERGGSGGSALGFAPERAALPEEIAQAYARLTKAPVNKAPDSAPAFEQRWSVWGGGFGSTNRIEGDGAVGSSDLRARTAGFAAGLDYRLAPGTVAGFALAGGGTSWALEQGRGGGNSDAFQAGVYATTRSGPLYLAVALAFANHWMSTDRTAPFDNRLTADFDAQSYSGRVEGGYRLATPVGGVTPYAAVQAQAFHTPAYAEIDANSSGGDFAHHYDARTGTHTRGELGARFDHVRTIDHDRVLTLYSRLAWAHDWVSDPVAAVTFQAMPGAGFTVVGATPAKNSLLATAGAELRLASGFTLAARFDGEFAGRAQSYAGTGTLRYAW
jgi:outer membrane autotransporter protein